MSDSKQTLPSLRRYLLTWFVGCAVVMVFAYTQLLEYYLTLGIDLRTQSYLERTAVTYDADRTPDRQLPTDPNLKAYLDLTDIPGPVRQRFSLRRLTHGEVQRFVNLDFDDEDDIEQKEFDVNTRDLCGEQTCELVFLYPYRLNNGKWLYLLHGVIGSDEDYEELEVTERVANTIGGLFAGLLALVSFLVVRNIDRPLRVLERWSSHQSTERDAGDIPDLRFFEFDALLV